MPRKDRISRRGFLATGVAAGALLGGPAVLRAKSYATRPIRILVGNAAGGSNDLVARLIAPIMSEQLGQPVLVENRPGAAGNLALEVVTQSPPDGHTLLVSPSSIAATPHTLTTRNSDPVNDLAHVSMICEGFFTFTINAALPATNLWEFVALVKKEPGKHKFGTPGAGGNIHLGIELFRHHYALDMVPVHYRAPGTLLTELVANQIQMGFNGLFITGPHVKTGKLRAILFCGPKRDPQIPEVPTSNEAKVPNLDKVTNWFGLHAVKGTPAPILKTLHEIVVAATKDATISDRLATAGYPGVGNSPEEFAARIRADYEVYGDIARKANVKIE